MHRTLGTALTILALGTNLAAGSDLLLRLGPGGYVLVPDADSLDLTEDFTIEAVFCPDFDRAIAPQFQTPVILKHRANVNFDGSWWIGLTVGHPDRADGTVVFQTTPFPDDAFRSVSAMPDLTATHLAITYDDDTNAYAVYLNGVLDASGTAEVNIQNTTQPVRIGKEDAGANDYVGGVDEVRFWNVVRSPAEILASFNATLTGSEPGLVGYWNFDSGTAADSSPNGNHGSLIGDASIAIDDCRRPSTVVAIDIKPGSNPAQINMRSRGVIPVAILSTDEFDAVQVDFASVRFGPGGAVETHGQGHVEDVNGDGRPDLVLHFRTEESGLVCGQPRAGLTGQTVSGQPIEGSDSVNVFGCAP